MAITDWPPEERPREKLLHFGAKSLTDAELLAIFLRTGVSGQSAVDLAKQLIHQFNGLRGILEADCRTFCQVHGLGHAKYVQLQACLEIARRHLYASLKKGQVMQDPLTTAQYLLSQLRHRTREVFAALFLDNRHRVIAYEELFMGSIREIHIHPRELIQRALAHNAAAMIVAHNHPSGDVAPSQADQDLTKQLKTTLGFLDIHLLDHIIVGDGQVLSFVQEGLLSG